MKKLLGVIIAVAAGVVISACGGGGDDQPLAASSNTTLAAAATTTAPVVNLPFSYPQGVPALGTTGSTTLAFTSTSTAPQFRIDSTEGTASGVTTFGSCIFAVTASTFPAGHRLATGSVITVNPCNINVNTAGAQANGIAASRSVALQLGSAVSSGASVTVQVNPGGQLVLNGQSVGTVTLVPVTG